MINVLIDSRRYTISRAYICSLAGEYDGHELIATTSGEHLTEFAFDGSSAQVNAKAFRTILETNFARPETPPDSGAAI